MFVDDVVLFERSDVDFIFDFDILFCDIVVFSLDGDIFLVIEEKFFKDMCTKGYERLVVFL